MAKSESDVLLGMQDNPTGGKDADADDSASTDVVENDDGSATITLKDEKAVKRAEEFYSNLADTLDEGELSVIAHDLLRKLDEDREARKERDKQYEDALRRTGLGNDAPGGADFAGASRVVHPILVEVSVDFAARAMKELFPPAGPAKDNIVGTVTDERVEKARRQSKWLNFQTTKQMSEFRSELEQLLTQLPLAGNHYLKLRWDERKKRPLSEFVPIDDVYLPFAAANFYSAERKTHVQTMTRAEFEDRVRSKMYRDIDAGHAMEPEPSKAEIANMKIEGKDASGMNVDSQRVVFEVAAQCEITDDERGDAPAPYLISIDQTTQRIVSIYRNWDEDDPVREELVHMVEFVFVPWRGAYGIGIPQMMGGIPAAATGALRALLDSAMINIFPGGVKMKAGPMGGQNVRVDATQINELDGAAGLVDDVRKLYMNIPVNPTSPVLMELLGFLVDAGKSIIKTTLDENPDGSQNVPVGTQMARIEQGMMVFSAIHARMHASMGNVLSVLSRINATYLDDQDVLNETGEQLVTRADFDGPQDVIPVSDPNIFSEIQRFAQIQTIAQRAQLLPQLYNLHEVEEAILERMKVPNPKRFLVPKPEPEQMNPVNENIAMSLGRPVLAYPEQDHLAHIQVHCDFASNPLFGLLTTIAPTFIPPFLKHITEHVLFWYGTAVHAAGSHAYGGDISTAMNTKDPETEKKFDIMIANASKIVIMESPKVLGSIPQVIQQAQQMMHQLAPMPPPPMDPSQAKIQSTQMTTQAQQQIAIQKIQSEEKIAAEKSMSDAQKAQAAAQAQAQTTQAKAAADLQREQQSGSVKIATTQMDNQTAMEIAAAEIAAGKHTNIKNGEAVGGKGMD